MAILILVILIFEQWVGQIYPTELQLNKVIYSDSEAPFFYLDLFIIIFEKHYFFLDSTTDTELIVKYNIGLKLFCTSEPIFRVI